MPLEFNLAGTVLPISTLNFNPAGTILPIETLIINGTTVFTSYTPTLHQLVRRPTSDSYFGPAIGSWKEEHGGYITTGYNHVNDGYDSTYINTFSSGDAFAASFGIAAISVPPGGTDIVTRVKARFNFSGLSGPCDVGIEASGGGYVVGSYGTYSGSSIREVVYTDLLYTDTDKVNALDRITFNCYISNTSYVFLTEIWLEIDYYA